jgi:hypothetical protein
MISTGVKLGLMFKERGIQTEEDSIKNKILKIIFGY